MSTALATLAGKLAERVGMDSVDPQELITTLRQPYRPTLSYFQDTNTSL